MDPRKEGVPKPPRTPFLGGPGFGGQEFPPGNSPPPPLIDHFLIRKVGLSPAKARGPFLDLPPGGKKHPFSRSPMTPLKKGGFGRSRILENPVPGVCTLFPEFPPRGEFGNPGISARGNFQNSCTPPGRALSGSRIRGSPGTPQKRGLSGTFPDSYFRYIYMGEQ